LGDRALGRIAAVGQARQMRRYDFDGRVYGGAAAILLGWFAVAIAATVISLEALPPIPPDYCVEYDGCWVVIETESLTGVVLGGGLTASLVALAWFSGRRDGVLSAALKSFCLGLLPAGLLLVHGVLR
jgi:hypothetical protein